MRRTHLGPRSAGLIATFVAVACLLTPVVAAAQSVVAAPPRDDPASTSLRIVIIGLVGLAAVILVLTAIFWRATRPALLNDEAAAPGRSGDAASPTPAAPAKIPASVVLAGPLSAPAIVPTPAPTAVTVPEAPSGPAAAAPPVAPLVDAPPPSGDPLIDAPPPLVAVPIGEQKPLVGNDSAWIIEPDSPSGLAPAAATATSFAAAESAESAESAEPAEPADNPDATAASEPAAEPASDAPSAPAPAAEPAATTPVPAPATQSLIAALSAIPDKEPTLVRFDDPPVQRVQPRQRPAAAAPAAPEPPAEPAAAAEAPTGAPGFDRIARETAAQDVVADVRDPGVDMAVMASALRSLPDHTVPPVGEFYDQDLDPGDPPGRG
ncbi:MAG: hypothetical protein U0Q22_18730 [Acidimicrobiales bacterium]